MDTILAELIIDEKRAKILKKLYLYAGIWWAIFLLVGSFIIFLFFKETRESVNISFYLYLIILFLFYLLYVVYYKKSIIKFTIFVVIFSFILGILSNVIHWEEKLHNISIPFKYAMPFLLSSFLLSHYLIAKKSTPPFEKIQIKKNMIVVGDRSINTSDGIITVQSAGNIWPMHYEDFYIVKIMVNWTYMLGPMIAGQLISGPVGMGVSLGAATEQQKKKIVYILLPLNKQQLMQFFKAISNMNVSIEYKDYCGSACSWFTENIQLTQKDIADINELDKKIILHIFPRFPFFSL